MPFLHFLFRIQTIAITPRKTTDENGIVNYSLNGNLPLDEAAKALVIVAYQAERPKKEDIKDQNQPQPPL